MSTLDDFAREVSAPTPAPAGGSVAAAVGTLAASLVAMIGQLAQQRTPSDAMTQLTERAEALRVRLLALVDEDSAAFAKVMQARRAGPGHELELADAWGGAIRVPAEVVRLALEVAQLARRCAADGPASTVGDAAMAALLAAAVAAGSALNARLNLESAGRPEPLRVLLDETAIQLRETQRAAAETRLLVEERLGKSR